MTQPQTVRQPQNLGDKIDALFELREEYRRLNKEVKAIKAQMEELESEIIPNLDDMGIGMARGGKASVSISEQVVPTVEDWDAVRKYIRDNDAFYLYERRLSSTAWRDLYESGEQVPGTTPFVRRNLSLRKL